MAYAEFENRDAIVAVVRNVAKANNIGWPKCGSSDEDQFCRLIKSAGVNGVVSQTAFDALLPPDRAPSEHIDFARGVLLTLDAFVDRADRVLRSECPMLTA